MYGVEAASSGQVGGLAAQVPGGDLYFPQAAAIVNPSGGVQGSPDPGGLQVLPNNAQNAVQSVTSYGSGEMMPNATPPGQQQSHWSSVLDFHNSVAPWILIGILVLYGWLHLTASAKAGPAKVSAVL